MLHVYPCVKNIERRTTKQFYIFKKHVQDGSAVCNVMFIAEGVSIKKYELLHDCVVKKIDKDGHIICKNEHCAIYIRASKVLQTIVQGQTIVAIAGIVKYRPAKSSISVNAFPFIPTISGKDVIYKLVVPGKSSIVTTLFKRMDTEIKKNKQIDKDVYKFFSDLLYPYKSKTVLKKNISKDAKIKSLKDVADSKIGSKLILLNQTGCQRTILML